MAAIPQTPSWNQVPIQIPNQVPTPPLPELTNVPEQPTTKEQVTKEQVTCPLLQSVTPPVMILDFDDTCFCTSVMLGARMNPYHLDVNMVTMIAKLDMILSRVLCQVLSKCPMIYMVTNAEASWVVTMVNMYMPYVCNLMFRNPTNRVKLVSACDTYNWAFPKHIPQSLTLWKRFAYESIVNQIGKHVPLVSIGDGDPEREACDFLRQVYLHNSITHVELLKMPTMDQLLSQWLILEAWMGCLLTIPDNGNRKMVMMNHCKWPVLLQCKSISAGWVSVSDTVKPEQPEQAQTVVPVYV